MDKLVEKKIIEAKEHVQAAEKSLKTSLFKRTPDYDTAASEYNQAAICCKIAKQLDKAIEYFQKSSDCYIKLKSQFNAAKQLEQVAFVANEVKKNDITYESISKAADLFLENGTRDTAGILLEKGANMLKYNDPEKSLLLYKKAINVAEIEDKYHDINSFYEHCIPIAMRLKKYTEAVELMRSCIFNLVKINSFDSISKHVAAIVIIHLSNDDWVSANKELKMMKEKYNYESERIEDLVTAFDEKDEDGFQNLYKTYLSYTVDNEVLKIAQMIPKIGEWNKPQPKPKQQQQQPSPQQQQPIHKSYEEPEIKLDENSIKTIEHDDESKIKPPVRTFDDFDEHNESSDQPSSTSNVNKEESDDEMPEL